ncbi:phage/plasmid primase, P4 family containing protein [Bradyrhizobium sp. YR681]|uniref:DNA primase family protein n=1 Tax=Bradyrhizobium sp. YR681 TaxID=1144344 RepID=UPI0002710D35|nr:phage/plasmid primase, P4 family [Bradyrhizobium sp. YR681]EJN11833.1 phage/plasmid primase, P4 family containing protein [Bradyrhizobium sp. YR681]
MTIEAVLDLVDNAPAFVDVDPATLAQAERKFGNEQMAAGLAHLRATEGDDRLPALSDLAEQLGALAAAGAIAEALAKASLEAAVVEIGLIRDLGAKAVKAAVAAGLKLGRKTPADLSEVRRAASAALGAPHINGRPREAGDDVISSTALAAPPSSPSGDADDSGQTLASLFASSPSSSPRTPSGEEKEEAETLENEDEGESPPDETISDETFRECADLDQSDVDNGKRLIAYFGRDLMVRQEDDVAAGQMLAWTGTHWDLAGGEALAHLIGQRVGDLIKLEAAYIEFSNSEARAVNAAEAAARELKDIVPDDTPEQFARVEELLALVAAGKKARTALSTRRANRKKWGISTKNAGRIAAMIKCAAPHLRRHPDAFNADPLKVATLTHTLSLVPVMDPENPDPDGKRPLVVDGRVQYELVAKRGHDREDLLTAVIPFAYIKGATAREFANFLDLFQPEPDKRRTVQQYSGMSLTAQPVQRVMFHTGTGGNGKSVFLEVLARVFGDGLSVGVPAETVSGVVANNPSAPTPDIARCYAKRYLRIAELPKDAPLKMETIKKLTGGERWPVRTMYKGYFEFKPTAKPHMSGNGEPKFDGSDGGMKRRLAIVEWSVTLPPERHRDFEDVVSEIVAEGSGILNWLIAGALDFLNNGFILSDDVLQTTAEHFAEMDPVGQFADAHVKPDVGGPGVPARAMFLAYKAWSEANGKAHMHETRFGRTMKKKFKRDDSGRIHRYVDVALHDVPEAPSQPGAQASPPNDGYEPPDKYPGDEEI